MIEIFGTVVQLDPIWVKFEGKVHKSKFTVTGGYKSSANAETADRGLARAEKNSMEKQT